MTDEELDALVAQQTRAANERDEFEALMNADRTVRAITALRTQLAEVRACLDREKSDHRAHIAKFGGKIRAANARADRAEAALAAQIEADARIVVSYGEGSSRPVCKRDCNALATAIRAQPHDRSAIERMLAEAREKALREAIEAYPKGIVAIFALVGTTR